MNRLFVISLSLLAFSVLAGDVKVRLTKGNEAFSEQKLFAFDSNGDGLGRPKATDRAGLATFQLPAGTRFRLRLHYLGTFHWSGFYTSPSSVNFNIPNETVVTLTANSKPLTNTAIKLNSSGANGQNQVKKTGKDGKATFSLRETTTASFEYKIKNEIHMTGTVVAGGSLLHESLSVSPVVTNVDFTTREDEPVQIELKGDDRNSDDTLIYYITYTGTGLIDKPLKSPNTYASDTPYITFTPGQDFSGTDTFEYEAFDGVYSSNIAMGTISVTAVNDPPVIDDINESTNEDTPITIVLKGSDAEGDALIYKLLSPPSKGTLSGTPPNITYSPYSNLNGADSFTYTAMDIHGANAEPTTATIAINPVQDPPQPGLVSLDVVEDIPTSFCVYATDSDNDPLQFQISAQPRHGRLSGVLPNLTYSPNVNVTGSDIQRFSETDISGISEIASGTWVSSNGQLSGNVNGENSARLDFSLPEFRGEKVTCDIDLQATTEDITGLEYFTIRSGISMHAQNGGRYYAELEAFNSAWFAAPPFPGAPGIAYGSSWTCRVKLYWISSANKVLLLSEGDTFYTNTANLVAENENIVPREAGNGAHFENVSVMIWDGEYVAYRHLIPSRLRLGIKQDGNLIVATIAEPADLNSWVNRCLPVSAPHDKSNILNPERVSLEVHGDMTVFDNFTYSESVVLDTFTYSVTDGMDTVSQEVTVNLTPVDDPPVGENEIVMVAEDASIDIHLFATDGDTAFGDLSFQVVSGPAGGSLSGVAPNLTYTPAPDFNGTDSFTFAANDGTTNSAPATVSITVVPIADNAAPFVPTSIPVYEAPYRTAIDIPLQAYDPDTPLDQLTFSLVTPPTNGLWSIKGSVLSYTPKDDFLGDDAVAYIASDGTTDSNIGQVLISVLQTTVTTSVWDGGGATDNWSDPENWLGEVLPSMISQVIFDDTSSKDCRIDQSASVNRLEIRTGYAGKIRLSDPGIKLKVIDHSNGQK